MLYGNLDNFKNLFVVALILLIAGCFAF